MRALDCILEEYGDDAELLGATLLFEVRILACVRRRLTGFYTPATATARTRSCLIP